MRFFSQTCLIFLELFNDHDLEDIYCWLEYALACNRRFTLRRFDTL